MNMQMKINKRTNSILNSRSAGEKTFDFFNVAFMVVLSILTIYPFWYILVLSLNNGPNAAEGPIWFFPRMFTLDNYNFVLRYPDLIRAFFITIARCAIGPIFSVSVCMMAAYALSKKWLRGRKGFLYMLMIPMFIGGTVISYYILYSKLGFINNFSVYVIPGAFSFFSMIIFRTFIEDIPDGLEESMMLDGANYFTIFTQLIIPMSKAVIAAFIFFGFVGAWLDFGTTLLFVTNKSLYTLQYVLYLVIKAGEASAALDLTNLGEMMRQQASKGNLPTPEVIKVTVMVVVTFPIILVYPFFQKYFVKGMNLGAIKG